MELEAKLKVNSFMFSEADQMSSVESALSLTSVLFSAAESKNTAK